MTISLVLGAGACGSNLDQFGLGGPESVPFGELVTGGPAVAANESEQMLMAWITTRPGSRSGPIYASEYRGGAWHDPTSEADALGSSAIYYTAPIVELDDQGIGIVVWVDETGLLFRQSTEGAWGATTALVPTGQSPVVHLDSAGNGVLAWIGAGECGPDGQLCCRVYRSELQDGVWRHPSDETDFVNPGDMDLHGGSCSSDLDLAVAPNGDAIIVWTQVENQDNDPPTLPRVYLSERRAGVWTDPELSDPISPAGVLVWAPRVGLSDNGDAVIVWHQQIFGGAKGYMKSERRGGVWTHPIDVNDLLATYVEAFEPAQIGMAANGNTIIEMNTSGTGALLAEYRGGAWSQWSSPILFGALALRDADNATLASGGSGVPVRHLDFRNGAWEPLGLDDGVLSIPGAGTSNVDVARGSRGVIGWLQCEVLGPNDPWRMCESLRRLWF